MKTSPKTRRLSALSALALAAVLTSAPAFAHTGHGDATGFASGFAHPFGGLDHLLAMVAVGVMAGMLGGRAAVGLPLAFLSAMVAGAGLGLAGLALPAQEVLIAASVLVLGAMIVLGMPVVPAAAAFIVGGFAVAHGVAHAGEMPAAASAAGYIAGFVLATAVLHGAGLLAALALPRALPARSAIVLRGTGLAIAAAGVWLTAGTL